MFKKRGNSNDFMIILILSLIVLAIFFFFINKLNDDMTDKFDDKACTEYMKTYALSPKTKGDFLDSMGAMFLKATIGLDKAVGKGNSIPCETRFIEIKSTDEESIKEDISKSLVSTWKTFGRGNYDLFSNSLEDSMNFCVIRYYIDFEGNAKGKKIDGLFDHMNKNYVIKQRETQLEFITNTYNPQVPGFEINTDYDYVVVYVHSRNVSSILARTIGSAGGGAVGGVAGTGVAAGVAVFAGIASTPALAIIATATTIGIVSGAYTGDTFKDFFGEERGAMVLVPYTEEEINNLECDFFPGKNDVKTPS